jgi:PRTRC genetic system protein E
MKTDFFTVVHRALRDNESMKFQVTRDGDIVRLVVQPLLGDRPEDIDDESNNGAAQVRAALALPLSIQMLPADLDVQFGERFERYGEARAPLHDSYAALIDNLKEAGKVATIAVNKKAAAKQAASPPRPGKTAPDEKASGTDDANEGTAPVPSAATPAAGPVQTSIL